MNKNVIKFFSHIKVLVSFVNCFHTTMSRLTESLEIIQKASPLLCRFMTNLLAPCFQIKLIQISIVLHEP